MTRSTLLFTAALLLSAAGCNSPTSTQPEQAEPPVVQVGPNQTRPMTPEEAQSWRAQERAEQPAGTSVRKIAKTPHCTVYEVEYQAHLGVPARLYVAEGLVENGSRYVAMGCSVSSY